jgi:hypothetical protein
MIDAVSEKRQATASSRHGPMEIFLFRNNDIAANFEQALQTSFPRFMAYTSLHPFCRRLRHTPAQGVLVVLAVQDEKELATLMPFRHLMEDAPLIMIMPTRDGTLLAKAHTLHPRFIGDLDSDAREVIAVIHKMLLRKKQALENGTGG